MDCILAPQAKAFLEDLQRLENHSHSQTILLDGYADLHNELTDWATNTEYSEAADEVMAILEGYLQRSRPETQSPQKMTAASNG
jgi:hypothetical protein